MAQKKTDPENSRRRDVGDLAPDMTDGRESAARVRVGPDRTGVRPTGRRSRIFPAKSGVKGGRPTISTTT
jgi:hypothetical protein